MNAPAVIRPPLTGGSLQTSASLEDHLGLLDASVGDPEANAQQWLAAFEEVGRALVRIEIDREAIEYGVPVEGDERERSRWMSALGDHLNRVDHRRALRSLLFVRGHYGDARPRTIATVTRVIRDYLASGGRLFLTPAGKLDEVGSFPRGFFHDVDRVEEAGRASRAFMLTRRWPGAERHIIRAVRMAEKRTDNDWQVLEAVA